MTRLFEGASPSEDPLTVAKTPLPRENCTVDAKTFKRHFLQWDQQFCGQQHLHLETPSWQKPSQGISLVTKHTSDGWQHLHPEPPWDLTQPVLPSIQCRQLESNRWCPTCLGTPAACPVEEDTRCPKVTYWHTLQMPQSNIPACTQKTW